MKERVRALRLRWLWLDRLLDVQDRVREINGGSVASSITLWIFLALFPLLLVAISLVGFIASDNTDLAGELVDSLGLTGAGAEMFTTAIDTASNSHRTASVVGLVGLAWAGSAVAVALQHGVRAPWQERPKGLKDRLEGFAWLAVAAVGLAASVYLGSAFARLPDSIPTPIGVAGTLLISLVADVVLFSWMFWGLGSRRVGWRDQVPGAVSAAVGFEILTFAGAIILPSLITRSSALYGSIGVVFAVLAWLAIFARLIVYSSTLNAVRYERRHGTDTVEIHVPHLSGSQPVAATRGGIRLEATDDPPAVPLPSPSA